MGTRITCQLSPRGYGLLKKFSLRSVGTSLDIGKSGLVGGNHTRASTCLNRHVTEGHTSFHREIAYCRAAELDDVTCANGRAKFGNDGKGQVFGRNPWSQGTLDTNIHGFRTLL